MGGVYLTFVGYLRYTGHKARIELRPEAPTAPLNRVADNTLARKLLG